MAETITLKKPLKRGDTEIREIVLREPDGAGELRGVKLTALSDGDVDTILVLTRRLSMTPLSPDELAKIGAPDLLTIGGVLAGFFTA